MAFANFAADSLFARTLRANGWLSKASSDVYDKDHGEGAISYHDCGNVEFTRRGLRLNIYQSRWSDDWNITSPLGQIGGNLNPREALNNEMFITVVVGLIEEEIELLTLMTDWLSEKSLPVHFRGSFGYIKGKTNPILVLDRASVGLITSYDDSAPPGFDSTTTQKDVRAHDPTFFYQIEQHILGAK